ncbi:MAG: hypothetical protein KAJ19_09495, partial [Gammaproteobacteria bacterium]|nr:hypothetical protein [Gammaproteobacteria bacterium]
MITENPRDIPFLVDFSFADTDPWSEPWADDDNSRMSPYQITVTNVELVVDNTTTNGTRYNENMDIPYGLPVFEQPSDDELMTFDITFQNNGNCIIYNTEFIIDDTFNTWDWVHNPSFFYTGSGIQTQDNLVWVVDELGIGETITITVQMIVDGDIPVGEHRYHVWYNLFYFDDGSLFDDQEFVDVSSGGFPPGEFKAPFAFYVTDSQPEFFVTDADMFFADQDKGDITNELFFVDVENMESYTITDWVVTADFSDTPYFYDLYGAASTDIAIAAYGWGDYPAMDGDEWTPGEVLTFYFPVNTDPSWEPGLYPFTIDITGIVQDNLEPFEAIGLYVPATVFEGYGPEIVVSAFTADDIIPGEEFVVDFTIENVGDDTLRDVFVDFRMDGTEEADWGVESDFKLQFDWSNIFDDWGTGEGSTLEWNTDFPEDMFYTIEDLDIDNVREIYELNLYVDGIYSLPSARIEVIKIVDLAPGAIIDVQSTFMADKDMVNGKPYVFDVDIEGIDSEGNYENFECEITVMTSLPGSTYNPVELDWFDAG